MKFKKESEFCEHVTKILLGLLVGEGRNTICVPEVPFGYFSNEQFDMLLLDTKNQEYLMVEYKLNDLRGLKAQVANLSRAIGIINSNARHDTIYSIFCYTGKDSQIERINKFGVGSRYHWNSIYDSFGMVYYWAYKHNKDDFNGGITGGNRVGFAAVYQQAIINLHKEYGRLDFLITHATLRSGYGISTSKKYYRQVVSAKKG